MIPETEIEKTITNKTLNIFLKYVLEISLLLIFPSIMGLFFIIIFIPYIYNNTVIYLFVFPLIYIVLSYLNYEILTNYYNKWGRRAFYITWITQLILDDNYIKNILEDLKINYTPPTLIQLRNDVNKELNKSKIPKYKEYFFICSILQIGSIFSIMGFLYILFYFINYSLFFYSIAGIVILMHLLYSFDFLDVFNTKKDIPYCIEVVTNDTIYIGTFKEENNENITIFCIEYYEATLPKGIRNHLVSMSIPKNQIKLIRKHFIEEESVGKDQTKEKSNQNTNMGEKK